MAIVSLSSALAADRAPVINVTDLYHPHQDCGDNLDLIAAYAMPEIDLKAVILDCTERFRQARADHENPHYRDDTGPRDPGFIPVQQLNYIFGRDVPAAVGPFSPMKTPDDPQRDVPAFQQNGINLILKTLRDSPEPVVICIFSSCRPVAAAYNRAPELFRRKVKQIHIAAGAYPAGYLEWNVMLDPHAFVCLMRSDLPISLYPCAAEAKDGECGAFNYGRHNSFWRLPDLRFIERMDPRLRRYLGFAFGRVARMDYLRAMDEDLPAAVMENVYRLPHNVWEIAVWTNVAGRKLVRHGDGTYRIMPPQQIGPGDTVLPNDLNPARVRCRDDGQIEVEPVAERTNFRLYDRGDPLENERALRQAMPALYESFKP